MQKDNMLPYVIRKTTLDVYEDVLQGNIGRFPKDFFSCDGIVDMEGACIPIIKYMIEEKLNLNEEDICDNVTRQIFKRYKLGGMLTHYFNDSPYAAINSAYPGKFKAWQVTRNT